MVGLYDLQLQWNLYECLKDPEQLELLREFMKLQKDMMIMLLSMLEGGIVFSSVCFWVCVMCVCLFVCQHKLLTVWDIIVSRFTLFLLDLNNQGRRHSFEIFLDPPTFWPVGGGGQNIA